jgi:hypothetical protein
MLQPANYRDQILGVVDFVDVNLFEYMTCSYRLVRVVELLPNRKRGVRLSSSYCQATNKPLSCRNHALQHIHPLRFHGMPNLLLGHYFNLLDFTPLRSGARI